MNKKEEKIYEIMDIVIEECCITEDCQMSRNDLIHCRKENVCMTRCVFVTMMKFMGYSNTTIAAVLKRTEQSISDILNSAHQYRMTSWAYRVAEAECTLRCEKMQGISK